MLPPSGAKHMLSHPASNAEVLGFLAFRKVISQVRIYPTGVEQLEMVSTWLNIPDSEDMLENQLESTYELPIFTLVLVDGS